MNITGFFTRTVEWIRQSRLRQLGAAGGLLVAAGLVALTVYLVAFAGDEGEPPAVAEPSVTEAVRASRPAPTRDARQSPTPTLEPSSDAAPPRVFFKRGTELWGVNFDGSDGTVLASDILSGYGGTSGGSSSPAKDAPQSASFAFPASSIHFPSFAIGESPVTHPGFKI